MQDRSDAKEKDSSGEKVFLIVQHVMRTFFEDFEVYVVGGGDSAVEEAMYLTKIRKKSYDHSQKGRAACSKVYSGKSICQSEDCVPVGFGSGRSGRRRTASDNDREKCEDRRAYKDRSRSKRRTVRSFRIHRYDSEYGRICRQSRDG